MVENSLQAEIFVAKIEFLIPLFFILQLLQVKKVNYSLRPSKNPLAKRRAVSTSLSLFLLGDLGRQHRCIVSHLLSLVQLLLGF